MSDDTRRRPIDELVLEFLERLEQGQAAEEVLDELCAREPERARALRRGVGLLRATRLLPSSGGDGLPRRVGPFTLLRRLGEGGMGVVYLARQESPDRLVALKFVRPDLLWGDGRARQRFLREVTSLARLDHPGIAPVFDAGEHDGVPWFSQQYVPGVSLDRLLRGTLTREPGRLRGDDLRAALEEALSDDAEPRAAGRPAPRWDEAFFAGSWTDVCLRVAVQVGEALRHAHERGVLHRDVKPANVLLTSEGRVVLVDFGLATASGADRITRSGAQLGSLLYMAPEQVDGRLDQVGPASDVYALSLTLYELLTLRLPYASESVQRLRGLILDGSPVPPRRLNPAVPADVEALCLQGMDRDPQRRYPGAGALVDDLRRALAGEPVRARPAGPGRRLWRWARRRPAAATAWGLAVVVALGAPSLVAWERGRTADELANLNGDLETSNAELARANDSLRQALEREGHARSASEAHFQAASHAVEYVMRRLGDRALADLPGLTEVRLQVVDEALRTFLGVAAGRPDDPVVAERLGELQRARAELLADLGRPDEAREAYERAREELGLAVEAHPRNHLLIENLGVLLVNRAVALRDQGQSGAAAGSYAEAEALFARAAELAPGRPALRRLQLHARLMGLGTALADPARGEPAAEWSRLLTAIEAFVDEQPEEAQAWRLLAEACDRLRLRERLAGDVQAEARWADRALQAIESATALDGADPTLRALHRGLCSTAGLAAADCGRFGPAREHMERALELATALADDYPEDPDRQGSVLETRADLAHVLALADDYPGARSHARAVLAALEERRAARPGDLALARHLAHAHASLSRYVVHDLKDEDLPAEALAEGQRLIERALELMAPVIAASDSPARRFELGGLCFLAALYRARAGDLRGTEVIIQTLDQLGGSLGEQLFQRAVVRAAWLRAAREQGRTEGVAQRREQAVALFEQAVAGGWGSWERLRDGQLLAELGDDPRVQACARTVRERSTPDD